jgi:hypothetical protein
MKKILVLLFIISIPYFLIGQTYQPYTIGIKTDKKIVQLIKPVESALAKHMLTVVGQYMPADDSLRWIMVVTHTELLGAAELVGGLTGFAATLRVAITQEEGETIISYTTPEYWGRAYYQDSFSRVSKKYEKVERAFKDAMKNLGVFDGTGFGSKKGLDAKDLSKYHYMMGMPYFDDTEELASFEKQSDAVKKIDTNLKEGVPNVTQVYKIDIPNRKMTLYGFKLSGPEGESEFLPIIDIDTPKHTAFLPYEVLVVDGEVHMLKGRYRIAIAFPDLSMGTFTKIMSTPGEIEDMLEEIVK